MRNLKLLSIITLAIFFTGLGANFVSAEPDFSQPMREEQMIPARPHHKALKNKKSMHEEFEKRLQLTEEQKQFAKAQREKSVEKIKPIIEKIKSKKAEIERLREVTTENSHEKINSLQADIKELRKQAHEIRHENMKAFEATLTETQKKELQKMKEEGRKRFEQAHKHAIDN